MSVTVGWALGTLPCRAGVCLALAHTTDGGTTWSADPRPRAAGAPLPPLATTGSPTPALSVRFATMTDGWIFGEVGGRPLLWSTHDGGLLWSPVRLLGLGQGWAIGGLETTVGVVRLTAIDAAGPSLRLLRSPVGVDRWTLSSLSLPLGAGPAPRTEMVLQKQGGWVVQDNQTVVAGARLVAGHWAHWTPPCTLANGPATLAAPNTTTVVAVCEEGQWGPAAGVGSHAGPSSSQPFPAAVVSTDSGGRFTLGGLLPASFRPQVLSAASARRIVAGGSDDGTGTLLYSADGGHHWQLAYRAPRGWSWIQIGFENSLQGIAIATSGVAGALVMTTDGGRAWAPVAFSR